MEVLKRYCIGRIAMKILEVWDHERGTRFWSISDTDISRITSLLAFFWFSIAPLSWFFFLQDYE